MTLNIAFCISVPNMSDQQTTNLPISQSSLHLFLQASWKRFLLNRGSWILVRSLIFIISTKRLSGDRQVMSIISINFVLAYIRDRFVGLYLHRSFYELQNCDKCKAQSEKNGDKQLLERHRRSYFGSNLYRIRTGGGDLSLFIVAYHHTRTLS